jgi:DNA-binding PadR family transcriptional regulator
MAALSELEAVVLGLVWQDGPCTPYAIRQVFLRTPSPQWSGSAGAIYPAVRRLERRGLIRSDTQWQGRRRSRVYRPTPRGVAALRRWLKSSQADGVVGVPPDPMRTRYRFLGALTPRERKAIVGGWRTNLDRHMRAVERDLAARKKGGNPFSFMLATGALLHLRSRRTWLAQAAKMLEK